MGRLARSPAAFLVACVCLLLWPRTGTLALGASPSAPGATNDVGSAPSLAHDEQLAPSVFELRERTYDLFAHGWQAYLDHAYPMDELKPLSCSGLGPGPNQGGSVNDVCGNFSLTLIDVADTLAVMGDRGGFEAAVKQIIEQVSFDQDVKVQVFEVTIRVLGGLLSTHQLALPGHPTHPGFDLPWYSTELLDLAVDLADRLLPAFRTPTGIPVARVNLRRGVAKGETTETCSAGAGSLLLEWIVLSRLTGAEKYEQAATKAFWAVWNRRSAKGLIGNALNAYNGAWVAPLVSHVGAGVDSFIEYAFKAYILTGEDGYYDVFAEFYGGVMSHVRDESGFWYRGAALETGQRVGLTVDSLAAFLPGLQTLAGDLESAVKSHLAYWNLWRRYGGIPESFHVIERQAENLEYPFRPEFVESTYYLYQATRDPFYLDVGQQILEDLEEYGKVKPGEDGEGGGCGLAGWTLGAGEAGRMDRMESFALSETLKYLYLLFDEDDRDSSSPTVFSTEGHLLHLPPDKLRTPSATRRALRKGEHLLCPVQEVAGPLSTGIRGRDDWDYARFLAGLDLVEGDEDEWAWHADGWCALGKEDKWTVDVMFSADEDEEDPSPGSDKLRLVAGGAELLQTQNVRAKVTKRLDGSGYDVTHVGPYNLRTGQTLWITDPTVVDPFDAAFPPPPPPPPPAENDTAERDAAVHLRIEVNGSSWTTLSAGTSTFGGIVSPAGERSAALHVGSTSLPLLLPPQGHSLACEVFPRSSSFESAAEHLLLVKRGGCTFAQKLLTARAAGAIGIVVWDAFPSPPTPLSPIRLIQPSASAPDWANASHPATEREVVLFLPYSRGAGKKLETMLRRQGAEVRVSIEPAKVRLSGAGGRRGGRAGEALTQADRRSLWVGSLPVVNAVVGTKGHPDFGPAAVT